MKRCGKCKQLKEEGEFNKNRSKPDGLQQYCKPCHRVIDNQCYHEHTESYYQRNRRQKLKKKAYIRSLKSKCKRCAFDNPDALDFHHRDPSEKERALGDAAIASWSIERIKTELEKCDLLCANCHRIEEAERRRVKYGRVASDSNVSLQSAQSPSTAGRSPSSTPTSARESG